MPDFDKPLFPESPACKKCLLKPCKRLFSGQVYPGKMIFVHHRDFVSIPCYQPDFIKNQEEKTEEVVLTDELADMVTDKKKPVTVTNPRWEHADEDKKADSPDKASFGDEVVLMVDVSGVPEGSTVTFDIYDVSSDPPLRIASAKGTNKNGTAKGMWAVGDPNEKGEELKIEFEGVAKSKASERAEIAVESTAEFEFTLYIDPEDPTTYDDKVVLRGIGSDYEQTRTIANDKVAGDGMLTIAFTDVKKGGKYTLIHNDGQEEHIIIEETVYNG